MGKNIRFSFLYITFLLCMLNLRAQSKLKFLHTQVVKDTFYGKVYKDPYRFLENTDDSLVMNWLHEQSNKAEFILHNIENMEKIMALQKKSRGNGPRVKNLIITENNHYFYLKKEQNEELYRLFYRKGFSDKEELLFEAGDYRKDLENNYVINYIQPSWNGEKIAIGLTKNDEEFSEMVILDVKTKKLYTGVITNCWPSSIGGISWLKDNSGFFYTHVPVMDKSSKDYLLNTVSVLYKLGSDPKKLNVVFSAKNNPEIDIEPADFPIVYTKPYYGNILIGWIGGVTNFSDYYYSRINENGEIATWKPLFKKGDKVGDFEFDGQSFYFLSAFNSPNYKLCKTNVDNIDFKNPEILVAEDKNAVITDFAVTKTGIYYVRTRNGVDAKLYCLNRGLEQEVEMPAPSGYIDISSKSPTCDDLWVEIEGWTNHRKRYRYDLTKKTFTEVDLYPKPEYPKLENVVIKEVEVVSYDGVKVPLSIIYKKGTQLNGQNRVIIYGYGALGFSETPYPYADLLHWVREGGIYAVAHVRGGGEKGESWYMGGFKQTKPNSWKDFNACTEYLIKEGYSNPDKIVAEGISGGGILVARAITERPDLYKAAIIVSGLINMLRAEFGPNGENLAKEFGTVNDSAEFQALLEMDACQHIKAGIEYPAVLFQTGAHDSRVPIWHSSKFAAGLQAVNTSNNPILLSVNFGGGHGADLTTEERDQLTSDLVSFALWQTGHPDFQLKK